MTKGERRVGLDFNPSGMGEINQIKGVVANLIDNLEALPAVLVDPEVGRLVSLAQTKFEEGCMFAVKAIVQATDPARSLFPENN